MPFDFPDYENYHCIRSFSDTECPAGYESIYSPAANSAWEDFYDLPVGSTSTALVPADPGPLLDEKEISLETAIDKLMGFREDGISTEFDMAHIHAPTNNNRLELHIDGHRAYPEIIDTIEEAKHHVHMTYFKFINDHAGNQIVDALTSKAREGVTVRFMLDSVGSELYFKGEGMHN